MHRDERGMRLEAVHMRAAQYTVPSSSVAQPAPRTMIMCEAPVCDSGEHNRSAEVRCEAILRYSWHHVVSQRFLQSRAYHASTERALGAEKRNHS